MGFEDQPPDAPPHPPEAPAIPVPPANPPAAPGMPGAALAPPGAPFGGQAVPPPLGIAPPPTPTPSPKQRNRGVLAGIGALVVVVAVVGGKILIGVLTATVVGGALSGMFGGPYEKLPADQRQQFDQRLDAALGKSLDGLSDAETSAKLQALLSGGLPRLDDASLIKHLQIFAKIIRTADTETCGKLARSTVVGKVDEDAARKAIASLDTPTFGTWVDVNVKAIEAESRGSPPARAPDAAAMNQILTGLVSKLSSADAATLGSMANGTLVSDADACSAYRDLYGLMAGYDQSTLAKLALYDVAP